jgi:hypothetical protein
LELVPPRVGVAALTPGEVGAELFPAYQELAANVS